MIYQIETVMPDGLYVTATLSDLQASIIAFDNIKAGAKKKRVSIYDVWPSKNVKRALYGWARY